MPRSCSHRRTRRFVGVKAARGGHRVAIRPPSLFGPSLQWGYPERTAFRSRRFARFGPGKPTLESCFGLLIRGVVAADAGRSRPLGRDPDHARHRPARRHHVPRSRQHVRGRRDGDRLAGPHRQTCDRQGTRRGADAVQRAQLRPVGAGTGRRRPAGMVRQRPDVALTDRLVERGTAPAFGQPPSSEEPTS